MALSSWAAGKTSNSSYWPLVGGVPAWRLVGSSPNVWNDLLDALAAWVDNVNANSKNLSNLGNVSLASGKSITYGDATVQSSAGVPATWPVNIDGNGHNLSNVATLGATAGTITTLNATTANLTNVVATSARVNTANSTYALEVGGVVRCCNDFLFLKASSPMLYTSDNYDLRLGANSVERIRFRANTSVLSIAGVPTYASDAAAGTGGLVGGDVYKDSGGGLHIKL